MSKIAMVGSGAVGMYYGGRLAASGMEVHFLMRSDYHHVREQGIRIESIAGDVTLGEVRCAECSGDIGEVDWVIVAWKATSNCALEGVVSPLLGKETKVLTLQNGLGNVERLAGLFGAWRVFGGLCFVCINRVGPGHVRHTASGLVRVGAYQPDLFPDKEQDLRGMVDVFQAAGILCEGVDDLEHAQWMKLVWNIPFNGLSIALGGVDTGKMLEDPEVEKRVLLLMREVQAVAAKLGHRIEDAFLQQQIEVTRPMGAYRPSSMIDYVEGREVEVDAIWREPLRRARESGVAVPELEMLLNEIDQRLEERK